MIRILFQSALELLFGCPHQKQSRLFTINGESYCVCLHCGAHLPAGAVALEWLQAPRRTARRRKSLAQKMGIRE